MVVNLIFGLFGFVIVYSESIFILGFKFLFNKLLKNLVLLDRKILWLLFNIVLIYLFKFFCLLGFFRFSFKLSFVFLL